MSDQMNQFFNFHLEKSCGNNSKIGFQSLNSDVQALKKTLAVAKGWAEKGELLDGDVLEIFAKFSNTTPAEQLHMSELKLADGTVRKLSDVPAETTAEEIPF